MMAKKVLTNKAAGFPEKFEAKESRKKLLKAKSQTDFSEIFDKLDKSMMDIQRLKNSAYPIEANELNKDGRRKQANITNIKVNKNFGLADQVGNLFS